jgi:NitT/TauT family transport system permease protein
MTNSTTRNNLKTKTFKDYFVYPLISVIVILVGWTILALVINKEIKVILNPWESFIGIINTPKKNFWNAIWGTLSKSLISFLVSYSIAFILALISSFFKWVKRIVNPIISIFRAIPTAAIILILLLVFGTKVLAIAVAILVVLPLSYQNILSGIENIDAKLVEMATVFKVPKKEQILGIYVPGILTSLLSSVVASFGLNIKVIIAAEVMGLPTISIGYMILISKQGFEFSNAFIWLVIAVILSMISEAILTIISRLLQPSKYPDWSRLKKLFKKKVKND